VTRDEAAREHVKSFNTAVVDGDWSPVVASFHPDAVLEFARADADRSTDQAATAETETGRSEGQGEAAGPAKTGPDATAARMGPFQGRAAIAAAYAASPPDDTIRIRAIGARGDTDLVAFAWSRGGTGTMEIERTGGLISHLLVRFD